MVDAVDVPVGEGLDLIEAGLVLQLLQTGLGGGLVGLVSEVDVAGLGFFVDLLLLPLAPVAMMFLGLDSMIFSRVSVPSSPDRRLSAMLVPPVAVMIAPRLAVE